VISLIRQAGMGSGEVAGVPSPICFQGADILVMSQGHQGINADCAPCGDPTGHERYKAKCPADSCIGVWIRGAYVIKLASKHAFEKEGNHKASVSPIPTIAKP